MHLLKKIINSELKVLFFLQLFFFISILTDGQTKTKKVFPKPEVKNQLFYVQRTMNINTLIYELNVDSKEELDVKEPIKIYWISYAKKSEIEPLNYIQRNYAYGLDVKVIDAEKNMRGEQQVKRHRKEDVELQCAGKPASEQVVRMDRVFEFGDTLGQQRYATRSAIGHGRQSDRSQACREQRSPIAVRWKCGCFDCTPCAVEVTPRGL